ncbi:MAG: ABC transporter permease, partial [Bacteroidota bacterium]
MTRTHLRVAFRTLTKYPVYTLLTVGGLALGIAAAFMLGLYVRQELSHDQHVQDGERVYRVVTDFFEMGGFAVSQAHLADVLMETVPVVEQATRVRGSGSATPVFVEGGAVGERRFEEAAMLHADSAFFDVFGYTFLHGNSDDALRAPGEIVLREDLAHSYFGDADPMGQTLLIGTDRTPHRVTGVVAIPPGPSHLQGTLWLPLDRAEPSTTWSSAANYTYVRLRPDASQADLDAALDEIERTMAYPASGFSGTYEEWAATMMAVRLWAQPLRDIHLHSDLNFEAQPGGDPALVYALALIGLFVLIVAGVNYVTLSTARASVRAREVGVKKTVGASRGALVQQFLAEAVVLGVVAAALAALLAEAMLGAFTYTTGAVLVDGLLAEPPYLLALLGFSVSVGLLAGLYPAAYLSSFRPARILKGTWTVASNQRLRGLLVAGQFAVAVALTASAAVVHQQLSFMRTVDKGFTPEGVVVVETRDLGTQAEAFRQAVSALPAVQQTAFTDRVPTSSSVARMLFQTPEMDEGLTLQMFALDEHAIPALGLRVREGSSFTGVASDSTAVLLNQAAVRALGLGDDPLGKDVGSGRRVIGVVDDFHFQSLRNQIEPVALTYAAGGSELVIRLSTVGGADVLDRLQLLWTRFSPDEPLRASFLDDNFATFAAHERMLSRAVTFFTLLALSIALLGLFGLVVFTVQRRTKEIGVRKVLGASVTDIVRLLTSEFGRLVLFGGLVALPLAWLGLRRWLDDFAYRIDLGPGLFFAAGLGVLLIALAIVGMQALRAASADPVRS